MAYKKIQIHGPGVSTQGENPKIWVNVDTDFDKWVGTSPRYKVAISLAPLEYSQSHFGYALRIKMNGVTKTLKENNPSRWSNGYGRIEFTNVPYGTSFTIISSKTGCGCGTWRPASAPKYTKYTWSNPGNPGSQRVNGTTRVTVLERTDTLKLTWTKPSGGTGGIDGYKIYWSKGSGWQYLAKVGSGTTTYSTSLSKFYNSIGRGGRIGFQVTAYNETAESKKADHLDSNNSVILSTMTIGVSNQNVTPIQARINWSSNINVQRVEWKLSSESSWRTVSTGLNTKSGYFTATGLKYNTSQTIQVRLTARSDSTQVSSSTGLRTLDIARITKYPTEWSVEDTVQLTINNPGNCTMQLYISYNNVEVISRNNLVLSNGIYTLSLTESERSMLYNQASSDPSPDFKFILKSFISTKIGEDVKATKITFPTKAWVKINGNWKRALVWGKVNGTWKRAIPWVKVNNNWKKI